MSSINIDKIANLRLLVLDMEKKIKELKSQEFGHEEDWRPVLEQRQQVERLKTKAEIQIMRLRVEDEA